MLIGTNLSFSPMAAVAMAVTFEATDLLWHFKKLVSLNNVQTSAKATGLS